MKKVCVLAEGAWGTAVATLLAHNGLRVALWCHDAQVAESIASTHTNKRYLPDVELPSSIEPTTNIDQALDGAEYIFEAVPVPFLRSVLKKAARFCHPNHTWVVLSKGIESETLQLPTQMIARECGPDARCAVMAGPSFAYELARGQITAVTLAANNCEIAQSVSGLLTNSYFRPYITTDVIGVQIGAALKNVISIGVGILSGAGYGDNTVAFFLTRGLHETVQLAVAMGAHEQTLYGLSGVGDLVMTAMGARSRNVLFGKSLGLGHSLHKSVELCGTMPEGVNTLQSVRALAQQYAVDMPLCLALYEVVHNSAPIDSLVETLVQHSVVWECKQ